MRLGVRVLPIANDMMCSHRRSIFVVFYALHQPSLLPAFLVMLHGAALRLA